MRWFLAITVAVLVGWGWFLVSPYWAAADLVRAIETHDAGRAAARINTQALRNSLARQVASASVLPSSQSIAPSDRQLAAAALSAAAGPLLDRFITADGLALLLGTTPGENQPLLREGHAQRSDWLGAAEQLVASSRWRGFRNVYFALPPSRPAAERVRLQLRLSRFRWRLVGIDLPPSARDRLVDADVER